MKSRTSKPKVVVGGEETMTKKTTAQAEKELNQARAKLAKFDPDTTDPTPGHMAVRHEVAVAWSDYCRSLMR